MQVHNTGIFYIEMLFGCESSHDDECPGLYIVGDDGPFCLFSKRWNTYYGDSMVISDRDFGSVGIEEVDETGDVWFYSREKDIRSAISLDIGEYEALRRGHRESSRELDISVFRFS